MNHGPPAIQLPLLPISSVWIEVRDGEPAGLALFRRHYSYKPYADGRNPKLFVGPGNKMVLITQCGRAMFVWRKFISGDGQTGVNCAVFRNEGAGLSSDLIREADRLAWQRWPGQRHYTYVNPRKIKSSNPGYCFKQADWRACGVTKWNRLLILAIEPTVESGMSNELKSIDLKGVEEWREYDFGGRIYRIDKPTKVQFRQGGDTHRVTDSEGVVHCVPAPGVEGCALRWKGDVVA